MSIEIDKADYALLNAVSLEEWQVYVLSGGVGMESVMNMPSHGLAEGELIEHFFRLWRRGLVECSLESHGLPTDPNIGLLRDQFDYVGDHPPVGQVLVYRLSASGGSLWEALASPDWRRFIRSNHGHSAGQWVLGGGDQTRVEVLRRCRRLFPPPVPGTERREAFQPWQATYWKTVAVGYEITFKYDLGSFEPDPGSIDEEDAVYDDCADLLKTWHDWCKNFEEICREHFKDA